MKNSWKTISLDGDWSLYIMPHDELGDNCFDSATALSQSGMQSIPAKVPGNFELDLQRAGLIDDPFMGMNTLDMQELEDRHLWYVRRFEVEKSENKDYVILFEGIDTFADVYLNGNKIGSTDNMLTPFELDANSLVDGENEILVHISPAFIEARKHENEFCRPQAYKADSMFVRKAPHMYGWDIMPRILSGGIWRSVSVVEKPLDRINDIYLYTTDFYGSRANLRCYYSLSLTKARSRDYSLSIKGVCKDSSYEKTFELWHTSGTEYFPVENPELWWVRDMGEPNLYDVTVQLLYKGEVVDSARFKNGIRTVKLERTSVTEEGKDAKFQFYINNQKLFARGTNWVPVDAFHSRDKERLPKALDMLYDIGCNMVRCWGGNVYEDDIFYDFCDRKGIFIWQDFSMACAAYPQDEYFCNVMRKETEKIVKRLRNHTAIALWAGDNECDEAISNPPIRRNPNFHKITRQVIPEVLYMMDPMRPYLPSSPYMDEYAFKTNQLLNTTERHLWGPRDYFKSDFYTKNKTIFASETGYHGCTSPESIKKYITPENLWPWQKNMEWVIHGASMIPDYSDPYSYRIDLMAQQVKTLCGECPENLSDFALVSQISQAEAKKFFIERFRTNKGYCTGILWWNLIDGWPQFSDAIVDYYYVKKAAYNYIKNSQAPVCLMFKEPSDGKAGLVAANEYLRDIKLEYKVVALSSDETVASGKLTVAANDAVQADVVDMCNDNFEIYLISWETEDGQKGVNHYVCGRIPYDINRYRELMEKTGILKLEGF